MAGAAAGAAFFLRRALRFFGAAAFFALRAPFLAFLAFVALFALRFAPPFFFFLAAIVISFKRGDLHDAKPSPPVSDTMTVHAPLDDARESKPGQAQQ
ncbi:MAG TPA: hypothetical protein VG891_01275 [Rhizomicrobium sp.]|nr:hypothetical protein [Rhizomicrobium sp.]